MSWRVRASSLVAAMLAIGVVGCGSTTPDRVEPRAASTTPGAPLRVLVQPSPMQHAHFALLRTRPEGLPPRVRGLVHPQGAGFNPALAQRIPVLLPGRFWLLPSIGQLCIVSEDPWVQGVGTVCGRTRQVLRYAIGTISFTSAKGSSAGAPIPLLVGGAPDGTHEALIHTRGSVAVAVVVQGVFVLRDSAKMPSDRIEIRHG